MKLPASYPLNRRILVIDDNQDIHDDFRKILAAQARDHTALEAAEATLFGEIASSAGAQLPQFTIDDALQGETGLSLVVDACKAGTPYAVAFVDMRMPPGWDGLETITRLWTADPALQIVICTAFSDYSWQEIVGRVGASDRLLIIKKPFEAMEVIQLAHALTEKWSLASEVSRQVERLEFAVQERTRSLSTTNLRLVASLAELQSTAEDLRHSEERFRAIVDSALSAITIIDSNGRIDLWNPAAERIFGWSAEDALSQPLSMVLPNLRSDDLRQRLEQALVVEDSAHATFILPGRDRHGREFPVELSLTAWASDQGGYFTCIMQDLSLRR